MNKAYDLKQKLNFPIAVGDFKTELESETLNSAADPAILQAVKINKVTTLNQQTEGVKNDKLKFN